MDARKFGSMGGYIKKLAGEDFLSGIGEMVSKVVFPCINVYESEDEVIVLAQLPGLKDPSQVVISASGDQLFMKGRIDHPHRALNVKFHASECFNGEFERRINLPTAVSGLGSAAYRNGLLRINLPKTHRNIQTKIKIEFT